MPATEVVLLSSSERRRQRLESFGFFAITLGTLTLFLGVVAAVFGSIGYWLALESKVAFFPLECFERIFCDVLSVDHRFNASDPACVDVFVYTWKTFDSPVVYIEEETRGRFATDCQQDLNVSTVDAKLQNGTNSCYRVLDQCLPYVSFFTCAKVFDLNNGTVSKCQTLLTPTSSYDPTVSIVFGMILLMVILGLLYGCLQACIKEVYEE